MRQPNRNERLKTDDNNNLFITLAPRSSCTTLSFPLSRSSSSISSRWLGAPPLPDIRTLSSRHSAGNVQREIPNLDLEIQIGVASVRTVLYFRLLGDAAKKSARVIEWSELLLSFLSVVVGQLFLKNRIAKIQTSLIPLFWKIGQKNLWFFYPSQSYLPSTKQTLRKGVLRVLAQLLFDLLGK